MANDDPLPTYYLPGEVKTMLDRLRRRYRSAVLKLIFLEMALIIPIRVVLDQFAGTKHFAYIKPYILATVAILALIGWIGGVLIIFHRDRMRT